MILKWIFNVLFFIIEIKIQIKNKYENVILSGGLGATFGSLLAGLVLARYNVPIATAGCTGILGGFMGYNSIKYYGKNIYFWKKILS